MTTRRVRRMARTLKTLNGLKAKTLKKKTTKG